MGKRILKVVGIVLGSVTAFVGVVVGVLAAQGKFKTPIVYPKVLAFDQSERTIAYSGVEQGRTETIYSYKLIGTNDEFEHEVNKTLCDVWFVNNVGSNLIELCDANGTPLTANKGRYQINANTLSYFKVNAKYDSIAFNYSSPNLGKVVLQARSENERTQSTPMTIWIDREVDAINLDADADGELDGEIANGETTQIVNIATETDLEMNYLVSPNVAWNPIAIKEEKPVELYYCGAERQGHDSNDYVKVDEASIQTNDVLKSLFEVNDGKLTFNATEADIYKFKMLIGRTYKALDDYANSGLVGEFNYNKLERSEYFVVTDLKINVQNASVSAIGLKDGDNASVVLNLYEQKDYISLNGSSNVEGAKDKDLGILMRDDSPLQALTTIRYNETTFINDYSSESTIWSKSELVFKDNDGNALDENALKSLGDDAVVKTNIVIKYGEGADLTTYYLVNYVEFNDVKYYCHNGACFYDETKQGEARFKLLRAGSYLDFFIFDGTNYTLFTKSSDHFEIKSPINSLGDKSWNIITKAHYDKDDLRLGILVVNSKGKFDVSNFFRSIKVKVEVTDLIANRKDSAKTINIVSDENGQLTYDSVAFEDLMTITAGSYNACVFVVKEDKSQDVCVEVIKEKTIVIGEDTYYLVGYLENGKFKNRVKIKLLDENNNVIANKDTSTFIYMLQLYNGYPYDNGGNLISTEQFVYDTFFTEAEELNGTIHDTNEMKIEIKPMLDISKLSLGVSYEGLTAHKDGYRIYEEATASFKITGATDVLNIVNAFHSPNKDNFTSVNSPLNDAKLSFVASQDPAVTESSFVVSLETGNALANDQTPLYATFECGGNTVQCGPFYVLSVAPKTIVFNYKDNGDGTFDYVELTNSEASIDTNPYLQVELGWNGTDYTQNWSVVNAGTTTKIVAPTLNGQIDETGLGFHDQIWKGRKLDVSYLSADTSIIEIDSGEIIINKIGETYLKVTIHEETRYIGLKVVQNGYKYLDKESNELNNEGNNLPQFSMITSLKLSNVIKLSNGLNDVSYAELGVKLTKEDVNYEDGEIIVEQNGEGWNIVEKANVQAGADTTILTIVKDTNDWIFTKTNNFYTSYDLNLTITSKFGDLKIKLVVTSDVSIKVNADWQKELYAGTKVQLFEVSSEIVNGGPKFNGNAIIKISSTTTLDNVTVESNVAGETADNGVLTLGPTLGDRKFTVNINGVTARVVSGFKVVPNVIVEWKETELKTNTEYDNSSVFELKQMKTSETYGSSAGVMYNTKDGDKYTYREDSAVTPKVLSDYAGTTTDGNIKFGWIENIGETRTETLTIKVYDENSEKDVTVETKALTIHNFFDDLIAKSTEADKGYVKTEDGMNYYTIMAMKSTPEMLSVTVTGFDVDSIKWNGVDIKNGASAIAQVYENIQLTFTFSNGVNKIVYTTGDDMNISIVPYCLEESVQPAYSETEFDLLNDLFNTTNISTDANISRFEIVGIYKNNGDETAITAEIVGTTLTSPGFIKGTGNDGCEVVFEKISGNERTVWVKYKITYLDGTIYEDKWVELTITNKHSIVAQYPYNDTELTVNGSIFTFDNAEERTLFLNSLGADAKTHFEPINIYSTANSVTQISFELDEVFNISRVSLGKNNPKAIDDPEIAKIEKVGLSNLVGFRGYYDNQIEIDNTGKYVNFGASLATGQRGYIVFKITTTSGNYAYYVVHVYTTANEVSAYNELTINKKVSELSGQQLDTYLKNNLESGLKVKYDDNNKSKFTAYLIDAPVGTLHESIWSGGNSFSLSDVSTYTTMTLALVYKDNIHIYPVGMIKLILKPENAETPILAEEGAEIGLKNLDGLDNGEYTYNLGNQINTTGIAVSSLFSYPSGTWTASIEGDDDNDLGFANIPEADTTLKITKYVDTEKKFTVVYSNNGLVLKVHYTYGAFTLPESIPTQVVGKFNGTTFENTVNLSTLLNNYNGDIYEITKDDDDEIKTKLDSSTLTFDLSSTKQVITRTFELEAYNKERVTITFEVQSAIHIAWAGQGVGQTDGNRLLTEATNDYKLDLGELVQAGSTISVVKSQNNGVYKFEFKTTSADTVLTIYTANAPLRVYYGEQDVKSDVSYVLGTHKAGETITQPSVNNNKYNSLLFTEVADQTINFVHLPVSRDMKLTIEAGDKSAELFVTVAQTYGGIESVYVVDGATYENVYKEEITNLYSHLFTKDENHNDRLRIKVKDATAQANVIADFDGIGFGTDGNPNKIKFFVAQGSKISLDGLKATFIRGEGIVEDAIYFKNDAGISNVEYDFHIMPNANKYVVQTEVYGDNYVSYSYNITRDVKNYGKENVAKLTDTYNTNSFNINSATMTLTTDGATINISNGKDDKTLKCYSLTNDAFIINMYYENGNIKAELICKGIVERQNPPEKIDLCITATGASGETVFDNFHIMFFNYEIDANYNGSPDTSVYANDKVNLAQEETDAQGNVIKQAKIKIPEGLTFELITGTGESFYELGGETFQVQPSNDNLFKFNADTGVLSVDSVGEVIPATLTFWVKDGVMRVEKAVYKLNVQLNAQFAVNDDAMKVGASSFNTNFVLTNNSDFSDGTIFPIKKTITTASNITNEALNDLKTNKSGNGNTAKYSVLAFDLYNIKTGAKMAKTAVSVYDLDAKAHKGIISIAKDVNSVFTITFLQDFTGDLRLQLEYDGKNGIYQVDWTIHVTGILSLTQRPEADPEHDPITNNGETFESLDKVYLLYKLSSSNVGLVAHEDEIFSDSYTDERKNKSFDVSYVIAKASDVTGTMEEEFNKMKTIKVENGGVVSEQNVEAYEKHTASCSWKPTSLMLSTNLPLVESSDSNKPTYFYVIYKVAITHLGSTREYYVAYKTANFSQVSPIEANLDVNVNKELVNETYLELFYYEGTYGTAKATYIIDQSEKKVISLTDAQYSVDNDEVYKDGNKVEEGSHKTSDNNTLFNSNFNTIFEFKAFIDGINSIRIYSPKQGKDLDFTLVHLGGGVWGINLAEHEVFFSNELREDLKVISNGNAIETIPGKVGENVGLRLFATNSITANQTISLGTIFTENNIDDANWLGKSIVGIGTTAILDWVNKAKDFENSQETGVLFKVPNGNKDAQGKMEYTEYPLYSVTYKGSSGLDTVCDIYAECYYICASAIYVVDYRNIGNGNPDYVWVKYDPSKDTQTVDATKLVKKYDSDNLNGEYVSVKISGTYEKTSQDLIAYKNENPTALNYPTQLCTASVGKVTIQFNVQFGLPANPTIALTYDVEIKQSGTAISNGIIDLKQTDFSKTFKLNVGSGEYITAENISSYVKTSGVELVSFPDGLDEDCARAYYDQDMKWTGQIILDQTAIRNYFANNSNSKVELKFNLYLNTATGSKTQTFSVVITKP